MEQRIDSIVKRMICRDKGIGCIHLFHQLSHVCQLESALCFKYHDILLESSEVQILIKVVYTRDCASKD